MSEHHTPKSHRKCNGHKRRKFDFVPNKEQMIRGAFYDLGKPINRVKQEPIAMRIATMWNEEIVCVST